MTSLLTQATDSAQGLLEDLISAKTFIRRLTHLLENALLHTTENSMIESLTSLAVEAANTGSGWINDCIDRGESELAEIESATQNVESKNVSANTVVSA